MIEMFDAMDSGNYDDWILLACWLAIMVVVWPAIIRVVRWWQIKPRTIRKAQGISRHGSGVENATRANVGAGGVR